MFKHQTIIVFAVLLALSAQTLLLTEACKTIGGNGGNSGVYHVRLSRSVVEGSAPTVATDAVNPGPVAEVKSTANVKDAGVATGHPAVVVNPKTSARK